MLPPEVLPAPQTVVPMGSTDRPAADAAGELHSFLTALLASLALPVSPNTGELEERPVRLGREEDVAEDSPPPLGDQQRSDVKVAVEVSEEPIEMVVGEGVPIQESPAQDQTKALLGEADPNPAAEDDGRPEPRAADADRIPVEQTKAALGRSAPQPSPLPPPRVADRTVENFETEPTSTGAVPEENDPAESRPLGEPSESKPNFEPHDRNVPRESHGPGESGPLLRETANALPVAEPAAETTADQADEPVRAPAPEPADDRAKPLVAQPIEPLLRRPHAQSSVEARPLEQPQPPAAPERPREELRQPSWRPPAKENLPIPEPLPRPVLEARLPAGELQLPAVESHLEGAEARTIEALKAETQSTGFPQAPDPAAATAAPAATPIFPRARAEESQSGRRRSPARRTDPVEKAPLAGPSSSEPAAAKTAGGATSHLPAPRIEADPAPTPEPVQRIADSLSRSVAEAEGAIEPAAPPTAADPSLSAQPLPSANSEPAAQAVSSAAGSADTASAPVESRPVSQSTPPPDGAAPKPADRPSPAVFDRLEAALEQPAADGRRLRVVVHDDQLGRVSVRLVERAGLIDAMLRADRPEAARVLADSLGSLAESLTRRGLEFRETDPSQTGQGAGQQDSRESGGRNRRGREGDSRRQDRRRAAAAAFAAAFDSQGE